MITLYYKYCDSEEEIPFEVSYQDVIDCVYNMLFKGYDKRTFEMIVYEYDIELLNGDDEEEIIENLYYDYYLKKEKDL